MKSIYIVVLTLIVCVQANAQVATDVPVEVPPGLVGDSQDSCSNEIGGYVKFDLIQDFKPIGSPDYFDVSIR